MRKPGIWVQSPMLQVEDKSEPPHLFPTVHQSFYAAIGELIVQWAVMEQNLNIAIWALSAANKTEEPGWRKRSFDKRWDLLKAQWAMFCNGYSDQIARFLDPTHRNIRTAKTLRDAFAHKEMVLGLSIDGNHIVRFYHETRTKQKSKPYDLAEIQRAVTAAQTAAGFLFWITDPHALWPLPSPDIQRLRSLPNTDHLRIPT